MPSALLAVDAPLTRCADIRALPREVAAGSHAVQVAGVITHVDNPRLGSIVLHDGEQGVYVTTNAMPREQRPVLQVGERLVVTGVTAPGGFAPTITAKSVRKEGTAPLPPCKPRSLAEVLDGRYDCQQIALSGVVQRFHLFSGTLYRLQLSTPDGLFTAFVSASLLPPKERLVDSLLRLEGTCFVFFNSRGESMGVNLRINESGSVAVVRLGSADPFSAPLAPELSLNPFRPGEPFLHRQRLSGVVTLYRPGEYFYVQAAQRAFRIETRQTERLNPGDVVEVSGFVRKSEGYARLTEAVYRRTGSADLPPAFATTASRLKRSDSPTTELRVEDHDGRIIRVQGSFLKTDRDEQQQPRLYFEHEGKVRLALLSPETPELELRALRPGSELELTGICVQHLDINWPSIAMPSAVDFHLLLRDMRDIAVLRAPSWWTPQRLAWALGLVLLVSMLILAWNILLRRTVTRQTEAIAERIAKESRLEERQRIGRDLHDTLQQELTGIGMLIGNTKANLNQPEKAVAALTMAERMVQRASAESRGSIQQLMSVTLDEKGLATALDETLRPLAELNGAAFHLNLPADLPRFSPKVEIALLRIAHEAGANAGRHAQAREVHLTLSHKAGEVLMEIKDDGMGFDTAIIRRSSDRHFGLLTMEERALKLKGRFEIASAPGQGTSIRVSLPLSHDTA